MSEFGCEMVEQVLGSQGCVGRRRDRDVHAIIFLDGQDVEESTTGLLGADESADLAEGVGCVDQMQ
ncbi:hypothetical protein [Bradyrhizobium sp. USDA 3650]